MQDDQNYLKIRNTLMNTLKNGKVKYSYLVRSSLKELDALTKIFHLSEISEALQKDTGLNLNYNSLWQAYSRFKTSTRKGMLNVIIETPEPLKESSPVSETVALSSTQASNNYEWLENISMNKKLKEILIQSNMSEADFVDAHINLHNPVRATKQIMEYMYDKKRSKKSAEFFSK
ncbi:hypothetical protein [Wohlfahrtiimonas chitiniclastica]|uniref:Uncharacterized protein n=1 Tax=Wohlfahrtiimonas chitiniclastica TaxID=400946 RepID=A0AB35C134_9GAMM|nr:hypothetical protein [Wohlfahrtiimonas chitiniclastica]MBS7825096.1 hypothetical protein [Wohlfahrtiimonas chitiniclastica]MBS7838021.1 hypothetical protein [Wohlfahrtiimonas chitiniclastica]MBS7839707.1 hypothetical protein [Wohlfahrtiimonas chitiniclastica]